MTEHAANFYTDPTEWAEEVVVRHLLHDVHSPESFVISDVDDVVVDSSRRWYEEFVELAVEKDVERSTLPNLETFIARTPRACFTELELVKNYSKYKADRMRDVAFHLGMGAIDSAATVLPQFANANLPEGYITTRPTILGPTTVWQLEELGFTPAPLLIRPDTIAYEDTVGFKVGSLRILRHALDESVLSNVSMEYVDDYAAVVNAVNELGLENLSATHFGPQSWQEIASRYSSSA